MKIFKDLPNEVQTIEESIHESQTQADLCGTSNTGENVSCLAPPTTTCPAHHNLPVLFLLVNCLVLYFVDN